MLTTMISARPAVLTGGPQSCTPKTRQNLAALVSERLGKARSMRHAAGDTQDHLGVAWTEVTGNQRPS